MTKLFKTLVQIACSAAAIVFVCMGLFDWSEGSADYAGIAGIILLLSVITLLYAAFKRF